MTDVTNFRQLAPYVFYIYSDNTVECFNRNYLPIGVATKEEVPVNPLARVSLSGSQANKLREMGEGKDDVFVIYLYDDSPDVKPRTRVKKGEYFELLNSVSEIIYDW